MLQLQHALVRVLTYFVAEQEDARDPVAYFLGSDWQMDVTRLVRYFMKVEDTRIARLHEGRILSGRDFGTTTIQVIHEKVVYIIRYRQTHLSCERVIFFCSSVTY